MDKSNTNITSSTAKITSSSTAKTTKVTTSESKRSGFKFKPKVTKAYTKNNALNEILNSTVGGIQQGGDGISNITENDDSEWPTMGGGTKTTSNYGDMMNSGMPNQNAQQVAHLPEDNAVKKALTRNYGDVLKKISEKKSGAPLKGGN